MSNRYTAEQLVAKLGDDVLEWDGAYYRLPLWLREALRDHLRYTRPEGGTLPSGWIAVPVQATPAMHNAAAFGDCYEPATFSVDAYSGHIRLLQSAPDWTRAWRKMVEAAPAVPSSPPQGDR